MTDLVRVVLDQLAAHKPRAILLAWSGGLDSTALLHALIPACLKLHIPLHLSHVDHQLRPSSHNDADFCAQHAASLNLPITIHRLALPAGASQAHARDARYAALAQHARALGADTLCAAHHQGDAIESALLHMQRGHGALGLSSLTHPRRPLPSHPDLWLLRPLIHTPHAAIIEWAKAQHISWIEDPTNTTDNYTRNLLRHHAIPALMNAPGALEGLARSLSTLAQEADLIEQITDDLFTKTHIESWPEPHSVALRAAPLTTAHPALLARLWQRAMTLHLALPPLPASHIDALGAWLSRADEAPLQLPGAVAERDGAHITLTAAPGQGMTALLASRVTPPHPLHGPSGQVAWFGGVLAWVLDERAPALELRGWRAGDRWAHDGRKVAERLRAAGVSPRVRWRWPLVAEVGSSRVWWGAQIGGERPGAALVWSPPAEK